MYGNWRIKAHAPGDTLLVAITVQHPRLGNYFTATLTAKKVSSSLVADRQLFFWLMPHKVAIWIYWQVSSLTSELFLGWAIELSTKLLPFSYASPL